MVGCACDVIPWAIRRFSLTSVTWTAWVFWKFGGISITRYFTKSCSRGITWMIHNLWFIKFSKNLVVIEKRTSPLTSETWKNIESPPLPFRNPWPFVREKAKTENSWIRENQWSRFSNTKDFADSLPLTLIGKSWKTHPEFFPKRRILS